MQMFTQNRRLLRCLVMMLICTVGATYFIYIFEKDESPDSRVKAFHGLLFKTTTLPAPDYFQVETDQDRETEYELLERSVYVFKNVCLESAKNEIHSLQNGTFFYNVTKRIMIYDKNESSRVNLSVAGSRNSRYNWWDISMAPESVPEGHTLLDQTAFFVVPTCPGNLHHFWEDEFTDLYATMLKVGSLKKGVPKNQVLYRLPWDIASSDPSCSNIHTYATLLRTLNVDDFHDVFYRYPDKTCFRKAVFGVANFSVPDMPRAAIDHVLKKLNINTHMCRRHQLTIIQRNKRRLLNPALDLLAVARSVGFVNAHIVNFGNLSVAEQVKIASCTRVLVGIHGAGLQWASFMRENSSLVEITWKKKYWPSYYGNLTESYGLRHYDLEAESVHLNWANYKEKVLMGKELSEDKKMRLEYEEPKSRSFDNIWKWADASINLFELENVLGLTMFDLTSR